MTHRSTAWMPLALLAACLAGCGGSSTPPSRNVVLILLDTTRAERLGCYGHDKPTSPNLDRLSEESVQFDFAIAQAAVTPVSSASVLTGLEPFHHGLRVFHDRAANRLAESHRTLAEVWQEAGGQAAGFVSAYPVTADFGLHQGFDPFDADFPGADGDGLWSDDGTVNTGSAQRRADDTIDAALAWLDGREETDPPFLLWVHLFDPHDPDLLPPQDYLDRFPPESKAPGDQLRAIYDAEIAFMDAQIGRLLDVLRERGGWEDTTVVVIADHGEGLGDHDWWTHGILYQEQIRVPLIVRDPAIPGGIRVPSLVRAIDVMPTILETAGVDRSLWPPMDGESLGEAMRTGQTATPRVAYADSVDMLSYRRPDTKSRMDKKHDKLYSVMTRTHKLIYHQLKPRRTQFFDLESDPKELRNLAGKGSPEMRELMAHLERLDALSDLVPGMSPADPEREEKLKSLGYAR